MAARETTNARTLTIALAQYAQLELSDPSAFDHFCQSVRSICEASARDGKKIDLLAFPEMHLFGTGTAGEDEANQTQLDAAVDIPQSNGGETKFIADSLPARCAELAKELGIWLIPGTFCERNPEGGIYNTAAVFSPSGELSGSYRKICPWRPYERYTPGDSFTVIDIPGKGRLGLTICYDAWFPELSRQVAWLGADIIVNLVRTTTPDRRQELVLARATAITNQVFVASVNAAAPQGVGQSLLVDPEGEILHDSEGSDEELLIDTIDLDAVSRVRRIGTAGSNRLWEQFRPDDPEIPLPLYEGHIKPLRWQPQQH
ncbi:MAG: carbon-nitrogen hydrolase family protein [Bifidobacterium psychraerophilum]|uniref:carbon-nitrogen hydrolase family protein n=1 Tax=Bifidobacterium psychraerophilum TaxID=218140 RepID=UPI0039E8D48D